MPVIIEKKPFEKIKSGIDRLADTVALTLGPNGKNILIDLGKDKAPLSTRDGVTVAKFINFKDKLENFGAQAVKQAAKDTNSIAGDGTTTATVLAQAIFNEGLKYILAGIEPIKVKRSIDEAIEKIIEKLKSLSTPVANISNVATISANNDKFIGEIIGTAFEKVGKDGAILVEDTAAPQTHLTFQEGMIIERGWNETSYYFITDLYKKTVEYDNPKIAVIDDKIYSHQQLKPLLDWVVKTKTPLILCIRDIEDTVLGFLVTNKLPNKTNGGLPIAVIKTPGFNSPEIIEDFSDRIGARCFNPDWNPISNFKPDDLGSAKRVIIREVDTTIVEGCGDITQRLATLHAQAESEQDNVRKARTLDRIARLTNSVAVIHLSADSEAELKDKKFRIEDALNATRHALSEGIVSGGGTALLSLRQDIDTIGMKIMNIALEAPFRKIVENTGENVEKVLAEVERTGLGYNALTKHVENLIENGIIDPVVVTRTAIQKAASVAGMLLITGHAVVSEEEK